LFLLFLFFFLLAVVRRVVVVVRRVRRVRWTDVVIVVDRNDWKVVTVILVCFVRIWTVGR
jgi:hypothetical protein